jgi:predicted N-acetyltransferase YhbS
MNSTLNVVDINIRNEREADYQAVEEVARNAFYNLYVPGCSEHYLVHIMRDHEDFIPELDFVIEADGEVIGNVMYTKAQLVDEDGSVKNILTFGPLSIAPEHQRRGYGKKLMQHSFEQAVTLGYDAIVIFGDPDNYVGSGFVSCLKHNVCVGTGQFPTAMMVKELQENVFDGRRWTYDDSSIMHLDIGASDAFDDSLPPMEKKWEPSQEAFYILSNSFVNVPVVKDADE